MSVCQDLVTFAGTAAALGAVYYAFLTVRQGREARREAAEMHDEALTIQRRTEQTLQLDRIADLVREVADLARSEHVTPPPLSHSPQPFRLSQLPSALARLRVSLDVYAALEGASLDRTTELATNGFAYGTDPLALLGQANSALQELSDVQRRAAPAQTP